MIRLELKTSDSALLGKKNWHLQRLPRPWCNHLGQKVSFSKGNYAVRHEFISGNLMHMNEKMKMYLQMHVYPYITYIQNMIHCKPNATDPSNFMNILMEETYLSRAILRVCPDPKQSTTSHLSMKFLSP